MLMSSNWKFGTRDRSWMMVYHKLQNRRGFCSLICVVHTNRASLWHPREALKNACRAKSRIKLFRASKIAIHKTVLLGLFAIFAVSPSIRTYYYTCSNSIACTKALCTLACPRDLRYTQEMKEDTFLIILLLYALCIIILCSSSTYRSISSVQLLRNKHRTTNQVSHITVCFI